MPQEPDLFSARAKLPVPGDYSKSSQIMNLADKSLYLSQQMDHFIVKARQQMSPAEIKKLPTDNTGYVNAIVAKSLEHVDAFHEDLADMIVARYYLNPKAERYVFDPVNNGILFVDAKGEIVSLKGAKREIVQEGIKGEGDDNIVSYEKAFVWTGPDAEKEFTSKERPIPEPTLPNHEVITARPERTKITPEMRTDLLYRHIREKMAELGQPVTPKNADDFQNAHIRAALSNINLFKDDLVDTIAFKYHFDPTGYRFIRDPNTGGTLFIDAKGDLVVLNKAEISRLNDHTWYIASYSTSTALTGLDVGRNLSPKEKPLPPPARPLQYRVLPSK